MDNKRSFTQKKKKGIKPKKKKKKIKLIHQSAIKYRPGVITVEEVQQKVSEHLEDLNKYTKVILVIYPIYAPSKMLLQSTSGNKTSYTNSEIAEKDYWVLPDNQYDH